jgi:glycosyltransferase involved in cell wall biosynthesis
MSNYSSSGPRSSEAEGDGRPLGYNVIGYVSSNSGLGVSVRNIIKLLLDRECPISVLDVEPGFGRGLHDLSFESHTVKSPEELPHPVNLAVLAIPSLPAFFLEPPSVLGGVPSLRVGADYWLAPDRINVALVWWELTVLPKVWVRALEMFDVVVAGSPFIRATLETHLSNVFTIPALHPFELPGTIEASRARFGLPESRTLFVTSFEPISDPERKNPFAAIDAFQRAFPHDAPVGLIIKLNNAHITSAKLSPIMSRLDDLCRADARIRVIDEVLSYSDVQRLYASCDVFVSLHRSEGLGFGLIEAMAHAKPVIATAWSGNMAFMNHTNSCLVRYKLIPVEGNLAVYKNDMLGGPATWADPDLDHAAAWMKRLVEEPGFRNALGRRAAQDVVSLQSEARKGKFLDEIRAFWRNQSALPRRSLEQKREGLQEIERELSRQRDASLPYRKRVHNQIRRAADRHLLWRFR